MESLRWVGPPVSKYGLMFGEPSVRRFGFMVLHVLPYFPDFLVDPVEGRADFLDHAGA
jgi:hypothetical protein